MATVARLTLSFVLCCAACSLQDEARVAVRADSTTVTVVPPAASPTEELRSPDTTGSGVIYVEATDGEIDAARQGVSEEDFATIADDLMFYRSSAIEHLEEWQIPFTRVAGRRPIPYTIDGVRDSVDTSDITLLDFIVVHRANEKPRVFAPNEIDEVRTYWQTGS